MTYTLWAAKAVGEEAIVPKLTVPTVPADGADASMLPQNVPPAEPADVEKVTDAKVVAREKTLIRPPDPPPPGSAVLHHVGSTTLPPLPPPAERSAFDSRREPVARRSIPPPAPPPPAPGFSPAAAASVTAAAAAPSMRMAPVTVMEEASR